MRPTPLSFAPRRAWGEQSEVLEFFFVGLCAPPLEGFGSEVGVHNSRHCFCLAAAVAWSFGRVRAVMAVVGRTWVAAHCWPVGTWPPAAPQPNQQAWEASGGASSLDSAKEAAMSQVVPCSIQPG